MACCTFFGHRNTPCHIEGKLFSVLKELIEKENVDTFMVGNQGDFDSMVKKNLRLLKREFPHIKYSIVIPYMPVKKEAYTDFSETVFPEELSGVFPKWAIDKRNKYMISKSEFVVSYVERTHGGAYKYKTMAEKKGLRVINLS